MQTRGLSDTGSVKKAGFDLIFHMQGKKLFSLFSPFRPFCIKLVVNSISICRNQA